MYQGELAHRRVKKFFGRTNKNKFQRQITKQERRERLLHTIRNRNQESHLAPEGPSPRPLALLTTASRPSLTFQESDPLPYTDPSTHYHISQSPKHHENIASWLGRNAGDPAIKVSINLKLSNSKLLIQLFRIFSHVLKTIC